MPTPIEFAKWVAATSRDVAKMQRRAQWPASEELDILADGLARAVRADSIESAITVLAQYRQQIECFSRLPAWMQRGTK